MEPYRQTIFSSVGLVYVSGRAAPPRQHLIQLLRLCGGQVGLGVLPQASGSLSVDQASCKHLNHIINL